VVMVTFVPQFVSDETRIWGEGLFPQFATATSDDEMQRMTREYVAEHGEAPRATLSDVADHIEHVARVAGIDHVGIGADFYGAEGEADLVEGLEDVSKYPALFAELIRRGWSDENLRKLSRDNLIRVFAAVEDISARLRLELPPSRATIEELDGR
jgi:membrane dipeptidase